MRYTFGLITCLIVGGIFGYHWFTQPEYHLPKDAAYPQIKRYWTPILSARFEDKGLELGQPIYIRIFKQSSELEIWVQSGKEYKLYRTYDICRFSGKLGPKLKEGDRQAPEGFYWVSNRLMKPDSSNHLAFNLGFPNKFDRAHGRTGSFLMVHGKCTSIGCYAMTDKGIEEIYTIADAALENGQPYFRVHAFPFRMTEANMDKYKDHKWADFWQNLKQGYDYFETHHQPPNIELDGKAYKVVQDDLVS